LESTLSIFTFFGSIATFIVWLFFNDENFNVYQNIVVVVVITLGFAALMGQPGRLVGWSRQSGRVRETILNRAEINYEKKS
jgi:hypothetical protein